MTEITHTLSQEPTPVIIDMDELLSCDDIDGRLTKVRNDTFLNVYDSLLQVIYAPRPILLRFATRDVQLIDKLRYGDPTDVAFNEKIKRIEQQVIRQFDVAAITQLTHEDKLFVTDLAIKENPHVNEEQIRGIIDNVSARKENIFSVDCLLEINEEIKQIA